MSDATNRLADETSPYLRQHADNPVDWYPWGDEALQRARHEERPIFLSVGYSACHWCHVMERESFDDEAIAELLNDYFVNIKVDREERPEIDRIYMEAVQLMSGQGGWPMSVWLTPELEPFYAGTYFPPRGKWGRPGFVDVVEEVKRAWDEEPDRVASIAGRITDKLDELSTPESGADSLGREPIRACADGLSRRFDPRNGGFATRPKFPAGMQCRLLLRVAADATFDDEERRRARQMADTTLLRMASGGMYDHLGGGFHRYSVDEYWRVPHFEKMLYDNALLMTTYVEAFEATKRSFFGRVVEETAGYVLGEMVDEATGAFCSSQDADTDGEEGKYYVWTPDELRRVLGDEDGRRAAEYWDVGDEGNFEDGKSVLHRLHAADDETIDDRLPEPMTTIRRRLYEARSTRTAPDRDDKIIASWNGLMIEALATAGQTFRRQDWIEAAEKAARFVADTMVDDDGLKRIHKDGVTRFRGCLDDYANVALGFVAVYEATATPRWIDEARRLVDKICEDFERPDGGFYYAGDDHRDLIVRQSDVHDRAIPSATSRAMEAVYSLGLWTGDTALSDRLGAALEAVYPEMMRRPEAMTNSIRILDAHLSGPLEVVCIRGPRSKDDELEQAVRQSFVGHGRSVIADADIDDRSPPMVADKEALDERTTAYLCRRGVCAAPATTAEQWREAVGESVGAVP